MLKCENKAKLSCLAGVHFIVAPFSFIWVYGNLSEYTDSYVRYSGCSINIDGDTQWTLPLYVACFCPGLILVDPLVKRIGLRRTGILAMILFNAGLLGSAWTIQISVVSTIVLQSVVMGMTVSIAVCISYMYIHSWRPQYESILIASVSCSSNVLSMLENQLVTYMVNPDNLEPDKMDGQKMYFSQRQVLERVPSAIIMLGGITLGLQIVGYILVNAPSSKQPESTSSHDPNYFELEPQENKHSNTTRKSREVSASASTHLLEISENPASRKSTNGQCHLPNGDSKEVCTNTHNGKDTNPLKLDVHKTLLGLTPMQVAQSSGFWVLWLSWVALVYSLLLKNCFYKQFGLLRIRNDRSLTFLGTFTPLITSVSRIVFGYWLDKGILGISGCLVVGLSSCSVLGAFWFLSAYVCEAVYDILILSLSCMLGVFYVVFPTAALRMFGPAHFSSVLAMLYTASTVTGLTVAFFATPSLHAFGWFWVLSSCSFLNLVALLSVYFVKLKIAEF